MRILGLGFGPAILQSNASAVCVSDQMTGECFERAVEVSESELLTTRTGRKI
jgi:hypothetical protein